jgi:hypothetical protein
VIGQLVLTMDDKMLRAVALVAAALDRYPGDKGLYERANDHFQYIKEATIAAEEI